MKMCLKARMMREQRGAVVVFTALAMMFLMAFVAFGIDFANYYTQQTRLQHAADAAALAGVARYADPDMNEFTTPPGKKARLVKLPTIVVGDDGVATFTDGTFTYKRENGVAGLVHDRAEKYIEGDYGTIKTGQEEGKSATSLGSVDMSDSVWSAIKELDPVVTTDGNVQTTTTKKEKYFCYKVDLENSVDTFFARIFGVETLPVKVSAMAMLSGEYSNTDDLFLTISMNINDIIPNYYSETIQMAKGIIYDADRGTTEDTVFYGKQSVLYYTYLQQVEDAGVDKTTRRMEGDNQIIGYKEPADPTSIEAEPIYAIEKPADDEIWTLEYEMTDKYITPGGEEIVGLFLDRDNISERAKDGNWYGSRERFTRISFPNGPLTVNPDKAIYARLESEPIQFGALNHITTVHGVVVDCDNVKDESLANIKPFVLAYDGPDLNRNKYGAPFVATKQTTFLNNNIRPGQIQSSIEPVIKKVEDYNASHANPLSIPDSLVQTAITTPGPFIVNIPQGCVFYGGIIAPRSRVTIIGPGRIVGFIVAQEINIVNGDYNVWTSQRITMPVLSATYRTGNIFDYTKREITGIYAMASSQMRPTNFTEEQYRPDDWNDRIAQLKGKPRA